MHGVVTVSSGRLRGTRENDTWVFKGIPYASLDGRRWTRPGQPESWSGTRDAVSFGPQAPQTASPGIHLPGDPIEMDEECLSLNVWTGVLGRGARPVMVWLHGGGFTSGTGASLLYRGDRLAARGVVVVTLNYRLGALGFLAHPDLNFDGSGSGNWGLWDQLAALEWVRENIAEFGGDPGNVTVFGESAGGMSICALLATDAPGRLFHKAVIESGPPATSSSAWAARRALRVASVLTGNSDGSAGATIGARERDALPVELLRSADASTLVAAVTKLASEVPGEGGLPLPLLPVIDGGLLERLPSSALSEGTATSVPLLIGTNRDEAALFIEGGASGERMDIDSVTRNVARATSPHAAAQLVKIYEEARRSRGEPAGPRDVFVAITTDFVFRVPAIEFAASSLAHSDSTFVYLFTWETPFMGGAFGSAHGLEIPFVFGTVKDNVIAAFSGGGPDAERLSDAIQDSWVSFARVGDPSCDAVGEWPAYTTPRRPTMTLGGATKLEDDPRREERLAWGEVGLELAAGHHHDVGDRVTQGA